MNWYYVSVVGNIVLTIMILFLARDRKYVSSVCNIKHISIDLAIARIEANIQRIWDKIDGS
jgi:hypothetical protein